MSNSGTLQRWEPWRRITIPDMKSMNQLQSPYPTATRNKQYCTPMLCLCTIFPKGERKKKQFTPYVKMLRCYWMDSSLSIACTSGSRSRQYRKGICNLHTFPHYILTRYDSLWAQSTYHRLLNEIPSRPNACGPRPFSSLKNRP